MPLFKQRNSISITIKTAINRGHFKKNHKNISGGKVETASGLEPSRNAIH